MNTSRRARYAVTGVALLAAGLMYVAWDERAPEPGRGSDVRTRRSSETLAAADRAAPSPRPRPRLVAPRTTESWPSTTGESDEPVEDPGAPPPVVAAIRGEHASPLDKRRAMVAALAATGPSDEPWTREAGAIFESWRAALQGEAAGAARLGLPRCYHDGCAIEVTFASAGAYEAARRQFRLLGNKVKSLGGRVQTPPEELADAGFVVTWMFLRPGDSAR